MWIKNEFLLIDGELTQSVKHHCVINQETSDAALRGLIKAWTMFGWQWLVKKDLIIGLPPEDQAKNYLVIAHRKR